MYSGWHLLAFTSELGEELTPAQAGDLPLVIVRSSGQARVFDAACPHRGAHLAYGGRLDGDVIVCPFHGRRVRLGCAGPLCIREHVALDAGGSLFVLLADHHERGFIGYLEALAPSHVFLPGFSMAVRVAPELVIENVFDAEHFHAVHGINQRPDLRAYEGPAGELVVEGHFATNAPNPWQGEAPAATQARTHFRARSFSPTLVATEIGDEGRPFVVFTGATAVADGASVIRVAVAAPLDADGRPPPASAVHYLLRDSRTAFEQDMVIWEHMVRHAPQQLDASDHLVATFRSFCRSFEAEARP